MDWRAAGRPLALGNARIDVDHAVSAAHRSVDQTAGTQFYEGARTPCVFRLALVGVDLSATADRVKDIGTHTQVRARPGRAGAICKALVGVDLSVRAPHGVEVLTARATGCSSAGTEQIAMIQMRGDGMDVDLDGLALVADLDFVVLIS